MSTRTALPRILFLAHRTPYPPNRGHRIRSYHTIRFLSRYAVVDTVFLADEPLTDDVVHGLRQVCERVVPVAVERRLRWLRGLAWLALGRTATEGLFYSPRLNRQIAALRREQSYDWVIAYCSSMAPYLRHAGMPPERCVLDMVDADSQKWFDYAAHAHWPARALYRLEGRRLRRLECGVAKSVRWVTLVSAAECDVFRRFCPAENVVAVENGVDGEYFHPDAVFHPDAGPDSEPGRLTQTPSANQLALPHQLRSAWCPPSGQYLPSARCSPSGRCLPADHRPSCVFTGALDYRANADGLLWFLSAVWPGVRSRRPDATFWIVGKGAGRALREAANQAGVHLTGDVPDVRPYLAASVVVAPLRIARGIQNKVLEGMAMARPVVASPQALEGLTVSPGEHVVQAVEPADWIAALDRLWMSPEERDRLGQSARRLVEAYYTWTARLRVLRELLALSQPREMPAEAADRT